MKSEKLEKIARGVAHPFISLLPNQKYFEEKLGWYNPIIGILESSAIEIVLPMAYAATGPKPIGVIIGIGIALDGIWRINSLLNSDCYIENKKHCLGTNFLEIPYSIYKKVSKK
jgi:hypothetical protein